MLDTQGEVVTKGRLVFVVNPGSDSITSFREKRNGRLKRVDVEPSRGDFPISITVHGRVLYVLNSHSDSIAGFRFAKSGEMKRIVNSVRSLALTQSNQTLSPRQIGLVYSVGALMRIVFRLGIRDRWRREFWRFLWRVITQQREKFAEALRLAAMGYHCRKLTDAQSEVFSPDVKTIALPLTLR